MKQPIDYISLMHAQGEVGNAPTRFSMHCDGSAPLLFDIGRISFLFVLQGGLKCKFRGSHSVRWAAPCMVVVDKYQIQELQCVGDTVVLECIESGMMAAMMQTISKTFNMPCSEVIILNEKLKTWCGCMFTDLMAQPRRDNHYHHKQCSELTALLLEYPQIVLGTLYIPLYACSKRCETCAETFGCIDR